MSYILDALKKSEQERQQGEIPNLQSNHVSGTENERTLAWKGKTLLAVVVLNVVGLVFWIGRYGLGAEENLGMDVYRGGIEAEQIDNQSPHFLEEKVIPMTSVATDKAPTFLESSARNQVFKEDLVTSEASTSKSSSDSGGVVMSLAQIPAHIRKQIPILEFSSHMYSTEPKYRKVIINGMNLKEKDYIDRDLYLEQITEGGVILTFEGYRFEVGVIQQWNF